jgi:hypothetical protein
VVTFIGAKLRDMSPRMESDEGSPGKEIPGEIWADCPKGKRRKVGDERRGWDVSDGEEGWRGRQAGVGVSWAGLAAKAHAGEGKGRGLGRAEEPSRKEGKRRAGKGTFAENFYKFEKRILNKGLNI